MIKMILKEKNTWILGTGLFIGSLLGMIIGNTINVKPDPLMRLILLIPYYLTWVLLVVIIKWIDRLDRDRFYDDSDFPSSEITDNSGSPDDTYDNLLDPEQETL